MTCPHGNQLVSKCLQCRREYDKEWKRKWRKDNPDKASKIMKASYAKHKEKRLQQKRQYYLDNKDKITEIHVEYYKSERGKNVSRNGRHKWEALRRDAFVENVKRELVFMRDKGKCHICRKKVETLNWHLDHIIPLSKGGKHSYDNVAVSHPKCNCGKRDRDIEDYRRIATNNKQRDASSL